MDIPKELRYALYKDGKYVLVFDFKDLRMLELIVKTAIRNEEISTYIESGFKYELEKLLGKIMHMRYVQPPERPPADVRQIVVRSEEERREAAQGSNSGDREESAEVPQGCHIRVHNERVQHNDRMVFPEAVKG